MNVMTQALLDVEGLALTAGDIAAINLEMVTTRLKTGRASLKPRFGAVT
jgi:hypothetical protein